VYNPNDHLHFAAAQQIPRHKNEQPNGLASLGRSKAARTLNCGKGSQTAALRQAPGKAPLRHIAEFAADSPTLGGIPGTCK